MNKKKVILIAGGSDGIGKAIAKQLASSHRVIILAPSKEKLEKAAKELRCNFAVCDVSKWQSVELTVKELITKYKRIDCLINSAGVWIEGELTENDPTRIEKVLAVNTQGVIFLTKAIIPHMKKQKNGVIINVISQAGIYTKKERSIYNASKWAITGFTKSLQNELSQYGIIVTGIYPGIIKTNLFKKIGVEKDLSISIEPEIVAKTVEFVLSCGYPVMFPEIGIKHVQG